MITDSAMTPDLNELDSSASVAIAVKKSGPDNIQQHMHGLCNYKYTHTYS